MEYEQLIDENLSLKKALVASKQVIERNQSDYESLKIIHEDAKQALETSKKQNNDLKKKMSLLSQEKKQLEDQFDDTILNLKVAIDQKQKEIQEYQQRLSPNFEYDMVRIKIMNELEAPHREQMEKKDVQINALNEQVYQLKRQIDIEIAKKETSEQENQKFNKLTAEKYKAEIDDLKKQIQELNEIQDDTTQRTLIRRLRKELEEFKTKVQYYQEENEDLITLKDQLVNEKNEQMIKFSKSIEHERNEKRQYKTDAEKLNIRVRFLDEEFRKEKLRKEQLQTEFELAKSEKENYILEIRKKDDTIHYLQQKLMETEEGSRVNEQKNLDEYHRQYNNEHEKYLSERNKVITIHKDMDIFKKKYNDLQDDYKLLKDKYDKEISNFIESNNKLLQEMEDIKRSYRILEKDKKTLEQQIIIKEEQVKDTEFHLQEMKKKVHSSGYDSNNQIAAILSPLMNMIQENTERKKENESQTMNKEKEKENIEQSPQNTKTTKYPKEQESPRFNDGQQQLNDLPKIDRLQQLISELQEKNQQLFESKIKLKEKLKKANQKIMRLLTKRLQQKSQENQEEGYLQQSQVSNYQENVNVNDEQLLHHIKLLTDADATYKEIHNY